MVVDVSCRCHSRDRWDRCCCFRLNFVVMVAVVVVFAIAFVKIDATMERRICTAVLKQLDDNSNDVQTIAVKCLGALLRKVQEAQVRFAFCCFSAAVGVTVCFRWFCCLMVLRF